MKSKHRFPANCPAFELLDDFALPCPIGGPAMRSGEIVEGTFNDQGSGLVLGFARPERWAYGTPYFAASALGETDRIDTWQGAWHYAGRLRPLTRAAREMLAVVKAKRQ